MNRSCVAGLRTALFLVLGGLLLAGCTTLSSPGGMRPDVVVAPNGNDAAAGTVDAPLATLAGARDAVRKLLAAGRSTPITVYLRGGTYALREPVRFGLEDSGHDAVTITYTAWPGETPVLSGGERITGWSKGPGAVWTATIPAARKGGWNFRSLFVAAPEQAGVAVAPVAYPGQRRVLARTPNAGSANGGYARSVDDLTTNAASGFVVGAGDLPVSQHWAEADAVLPVNWTSSMLPVAELTPDTHILRLAQPSRHTLPPGQRYYIENLPEALDTSGEWYLDRRAGVLSYIPLPGEEPGDGPHQVAIIAPRATAFIAISGDKPGDKTGEAADPRSVSGLRFRGLQFRYADYVLPATGYSDGQGAARLPAVITLSNARDCVIERCAIVHIGTYAIEVGAGCRDTRIEHNELSDLGAGGVIVRATSVATTIANNFIHDGGRAYASGTPVLVQDSSANVITHNEICDFNWMGICVGWSWGFAPTQCHDNRIEYNHLHHLGRGVLTDIGGIYTLGISTGTVIRNNVIHHVWDCAEGYLACGIYPDEGSSGLLIENNVVYQTAWGGLHVHYGRDNVVRNNVFAFGRSAQIQMGRNKGSGDGGNWRDVTRSGMTFERNIVLYDRGDLWKRDSDLVADHNLYWNTAGPVVFPHDTDVTAWRALGRDQHSLVADPQCVDPAAGDFRLLPDSPALALGFVPIDTSTVGLQGEPEWIAQPQRIVRAPVVFPRAEPRGLRRISDDFEATAVDAAPRHAHIIGDDRGSGGQSASIRVSADTASTGTHSLKFQDVPGLTSDWNPHLAYEVSAVTGTARASFALRLEPGANVHHEWRDWSRGANGYLIGPSLRCGPDGMLSANNVPLLVIPHSQWVRITITCALGDRADGSYALTVAIPGKEPAVFPHLACDPHFTLITWLGFMSMSTEATVFYLDDLQWECSQTEGRP